MKNTENTSIKIIDDEDNNRSKPTIPDGDWGWMVVLSSLVLSLIQDGISFSFGMLYTPFEREFQSSASATSWIGSLFLSVPLLSGPIASALVDKYGCRTMTIIGGLISASGFIISSFVSNIIVMYFTFGIIAGMGLGLTYITAVVSIAFWFDKKRNLAVGLGACGTGIGTFVYSPFTNFLLEEYNWRGTVILLGGTILNICVCGSLMRDPAWIIEQNRQNSKSTRSSTLSLASSHDLREVRQLLKEGKDGEYILKTLATCIDSDGVVNKNEHHHQSVLNLPTFIRQDEKVPIEVLRKLSENKKLYNMILENYPNLILCRSTSEKGLDKLAEEAVTRIPVTFSFKLKRDKPKPVTHQHSLQSDTPQVMEPLLANKFTKPKLHKQFSSTGSPHQRYFKNMRFPRHSLIQRGAVLNANKYKLRASSCPNIYKVSMTTLAHEKDEEWYSGIVQGFEDFSMFSELHFFLMSLSTSILFLFFMTPFFYLPNHMADLGYSDLHSSYIMSVIGITNTIGMVVLGWAGDQDWMNVTLTYGICLILCGLFCSGMFVFTTHYVVLMISAGLYGITLASSFSFTPIILVELLPLDRFTVAYGLILLCQGVGHLIGPPLCGLLRDLTSAWDLSFHLSGVSIIFSGLLILIIPFTTNRKLWGRGLMEKRVSESSA